MASHALGRSMLQQYCKLSPNAEHNFAITTHHTGWEETGMIRKLKSGEYRLYSRKKDAKTGKRRNLGTFASLEKAQQHERAVQYFKRH